MSGFAGSLDANVVLRLIVKDIPEQHLKAKKLLSDSQKQFAVSDTALFEVAFVLARIYGLTRRQVFEAITGFMNIKQVNCNRTVFVKALQLYVSSSGLSLEDCAITTYAELGQATPLYTFDVKLAKSLASAKLL